MYFRMPGRGETSRNKRISHLSPSRRLPPSQAWAVELFSKNVHRKLSTSNTSFHIVHVTGKAWSGSALPPDGSRKR